MLLDTRDPGKEFYFKSKEIDLNIYADRFWKKIGVQNRLAPGFNPKSPRYRPHLQTNGLI